MTGLTPPFSPFNNGPALLAWTGKKNVRFDVVSYAGAQQNNAPVHFIAPAAVSLKDYTDIWRFRPTAPGSR